MFRFILTLCVALAFAFPSMGADSNTSKLPDWTLVIFMSSDNDLSDAAIEDLNELMKVGSTSRVNVVVYADSNDQDISTKIYHIQKNNKVVIKDFGKNIDSGDWHQLVDLFKIAQEKFPAQKYLVDVWNHGNGWEKRKTNSEKGIAYDDSTGNNITTPQLGEALKAIAALRGKKIEVFATDACLMQMVEVAYEFRDEVELFASSEEVEPDQGWPYTEILSAITQKPNMTPLEFATEISRLYVDSYKNGTQQGDLATFSVVSVPELKDAIATLPKFIDVFSELTSMRSKIFSAIKATQSYDSPEYADLLDFFTNVRPAILSNPEAVAALDKSKAAFAKAIKFETHFGSRVEKSTGLSIWLPKKRSILLEIRYEDINFQKDLNWQKFVTSYLPKD